MATHQREQRLDALMDDVPNDERPGLLYVLVRVLAETASDEAWDDALRRLARFRTCQLTETKTTAAAAR
jgi:hypothetical protein